MMVVQGYTFVNSWRKPGELITMAQGDPLSHSSISKMMSGKGFAKSNVTKYISSISEDPGYVYIEFMATEENIRRADFNIPKKNRQYYIARDSKVGTMVRAWGFY